MSIDKRIKILEDKFKQQKLDMITLCERIEIVDMKIDKLVGKLRRVFREVEE